MKRPIELFKFYTTSGDKVWNVTSRAQPYLASDGITYLSEPLSADRIISKGSADESAFNIQCAPDFGLVKLFGSGIPAEQIHVEVLREDEVTKERLTLFRAHVLAIQFSSTQVTIACNTIMNATAKNLLSSSYRAQCNHTLFDGKCGLIESEWRDEVTVSAINGNGMILQIDSAREDGYLANGLLTFGYYKRMITEHIQGQIRVLGAVDGLKVGDKVFVTKGCNKSYAGCTEFSNEARFWGFPHVPNSNLFVNGFVAEEVDS
ncbi:phage BR0599 family protein [Vibrio parahaemolyticus]|nr:phage BR0599 family protein [Vibrio parahaemolyticus]